MCGFTNMPLEKKFLLKYYLIIKLSNVSPLPSEVLVPWKEILLIPYIAFTAIVWWRIKVFEGQKLKIYKLFHVTRMHSEVKSEFSLAA